jgi:hypothetical protein
VRSLRADQLDVAQRVPQRAQKVEEQQTSISQLKSEMQTMIAQFKEQAEQIQKVSASDYEARATIDCE